MCFVMGMNHTADHLGPKGVDALDCHPSMNAELERNAIDTPPPRIAESRATGVALEQPGARILCSTIGRAQAAWELAASRPTATVDAWFLDLYPLELVRRQLVEHRHLVPGLSLTCSADFPDQPYDLAVVPCSTRGEAELTRDLIQSAYQRLDRGGSLVAAVDNPNDRWLHRQLRDWFPKVTAVTFPDAMVYIVRKASAAVRYRSFRCEFAFRDPQRPRGEPIRAVTRPGVFSHRHLDPGARCLIEAAHAPPGGRVIDIGCGAGVVGLALAARDASLSVDAIDSNARAVLCTREAAELNRLPRVAARITCDGACDQPGTFDLAVANPPYYSDFRIASLFVNTARCALKSGGELILVTKHPQWYQENLFPQWREIEFTTGAQYTIIRARRA